MRALRTGNRFFSCNAERQRPALVCPSQLSSMQPLVSKTSDRSSSLLRMHAPSLWPCNGSRVVQSNRNQCNLTDLLRRTEPRLQSTQASLLTLLPMCCTNSLWNSGGWARRGRLNVSSLKLTSTSADLPFLSCADLGDSGCCARSLQVKK